MRRRFLITGVFVLLLLMIVAVVLWSFQKSAADSTQNQEVNTVKPKGEILISPEVLQEDAPDGSYTINVSYPVITLTEDAAKTITTNEFIDSLIQEEIKNFLSQLSPDSYIEEKVASSYEMNYTITYSDINYLGIDFVISTYSSGAAHPYTYNKTVLYSINDGKEVSLANVFTDKNYLNQLSEKSRASLKQTARDSDYWDDSIGEWIDSGTAPKTENFQAFILTSGLMTLIFPPYQVDSYAAGSKKVEIPLDSLTGLSSVGKYFLNLKN